jgi:hypothetical protein
VARWAVQWWSHPCHRQPYLAFVGKGALEKGAGTSIREGWGESASLCLGSWEVRRGMQ